MTGDVTIVDHGGGNLLKVSRAVSEAGGNPTVSGDVEEIRDAERLILPGVGAFSQGMKGLEDKGLTDAVHAFTETERPFLGICLGMQMMMSESLEFGTHRGLDLIAGKVDAIPPTTADGRSHRIPLVGWMPLAPAPGADWSDTALCTVSAGSPVYFVHSYAAIPDAAADRLAETDYNGRVVCAAVRRGHLVGCQFHPEMSGKIGLQILSSFVSQ